MDDKRLTHTQFRDMPMNGLCEGGHHFVLVDPSDEQTAEELDLDEYPNGIVCTRCGASDV